MSFKTQNFFIMLSPDQYSKLIPYEGLYIEKLKNSLVLDDRNIFVCEMSRSDFELCLIELELRKDRNPDLIKRFYEIGELQSSEFRQSVKQKLDALHRVRY